jgi:hypothetical protein
MYDDYDSYNSYSYEDEEAYDWLDMSEDDVEFDDNEECFFCGAWVQNCQCDREELQ